MTPDFSKEKLKTRKSRKVGFKILRKMALETKFHVINILN